MYRETIDSGNGGEIHMLRNKRKSLEFAIIDLALELIPLLGSSDGAMHSSFTFEGYVINRSPQWNYGSVIQCSHYLFYTLWLPGFHLHRTSAFALITPDHYVLA